VRGFVMCCLSYVGTERSNQRGHAIGMEPRVHEWGVKLVYNCSQKSQKDYATLEAGYENTKYGIQ
jgi:hypothetical protein